MIDIDSNNKSFKFKTETKHKSGKKLTRSTEQIQPKFLTKISSKLMPSLKIQPLTITLGQHGTAMKQKTNGKVISKSGMIQYQRAYLGNDHNSHHLIVPAKVKEARGSKRLFNPRQNGPKEDYRPTKVIVEPSEEVYAPQTEDEYVEGKCRTAVFNNDSETPALPQTWRPLDDNDRESDLDIPDTPDVQNKETFKVIQIKQTNRSLEHIASPVKNPVWFGDQRMPPMTFGNSPKLADHSKYTTLQNSDKEKSSTTLWMSGSRLQLSINPLMEAREKIKSILEQGAVSDADGPTITLTSQNRRGTPSAHSGSPTRQRNIDYSKPVRLVTADARSSVYADGSRSSVSKTSWQPHFHSELRARLERPFEVKTKRAVRNSNGNFSGRKSIGKSEILTILKLHKQLQHRVHSLADKFKEEQGNTIPNPYY